VTTHDEIQWQMAGFDEERPPATVGWRRPRRVRLESDELVFEWFDDQVIHANALDVTRVRPLAWREWRDARGRLMTQGIADVYPSRAMLIRFARLSDAPAERIRAFADHFGALQEQVSDRPEWQTPPLLPDRQGLSYWRLISGLFSRALSLAANPRTPRNEIDLSWLVNGHLWQAGVEDFLAFVDGQPRILHSAGGLYGGLAVELLSAVAKVGLRLCVGCGSPLEKGGRRYCAACRNSGEPERNRQAQWRMRQSKRNPRQAAEAGP
jgi:hypothetical protein